MLSDLFGPKERTIHRWYQMFVQTGNIEPKAMPKRTSRWPEYVVNGVKKYIKEHPTFFLEELQSFIEEHWPEIENVSIPTICRALHFDMGLTRKVLTKAARECVPSEVANFRVKLATIYSYPEQMVFIDETSKDGRDAYRKYAWGPKGQKVPVKLPFARGKRLSILAALDHKGFLAWETTPGTFSRHEFHYAFANKILPTINPWPLPRSIIVMDNAKIHLYSGLEDMVHKAGAILMFLPPYSPELNPIEMSFGQLKKWIQRHANLVFPSNPEGVLDVAMQVCHAEASAKDAMGFFGHCGYGFGSLCDDVFNRFQGLQ